MYLRVNLMGPGPRLMEKEFYRAAVSQIFRNTDLVPFGMARITNSCACGTYVCVSTKDVFKNFT